MHVNEADRTEAVHLVARHGAAAGEIADDHRRRAHGAGDRDEARRWRKIRRLILSAVPGAAGRARRRAERDAA